ncbi:MAG: trigger factor [Bacteroides sp.]|jgi:trigger factor|nr:trigger factor [Bacteroides sp.]
MNIVQESTGQLEAVLKVELKEDDYREKVDKELKNLQRKAQVPGFRPGKVPMGMIRKMYGKNVLADEVNKMLVDEVYKYIKDNDLNVLGNPLPDHEAAEKIDWDNQTEFTFAYEIGLAPKVDLELTENIEVDYHRVKVSDDTLDSYILDIRKQFGKHVSPEVAEAGDVLFGEFAELDSPGQLKENGHTHKANLMIDFVKDEEVKKELIGMKIGDTVEFDLVKAVENETEAAGIIGVKKDELSNYNPMFRFTVETISRIEPAELNEELFKKAMPGEDVETEEAFRQKLSDQLSGQYQVDSDKHFRNEVMKKLLEETKLDLPETFLKKWLKDANKGEFTAEQVDEEFPALADTFRWQLIESHLITSNHVEVTREEVTDYLGSFMRAQMRQYGQENVEQELIDGFVKNIMQNQEEIKKVYDDLFDKKLLALYKEKLKLNEVEISFDDFVKLVTEKYQADKASAK